MTGITGVGMKDWSELWHQFNATLTQQPALMVLAVWLGMALVLMFALEGMLLNLFPTLVLQRYRQKPPQEKAAPAPLPGLRDIPAKMPEPMVEAVAGPVATNSAAPAAKIRLPKKRKKTAPGLKPVRANSGGRRTLPSRERQSRGIPRLLAPKN
jgi:hypothetical protein